MNKYGKWLYDYSCHFSYHGSVLNFSNLKYDILDSLSENSCKCRSRLSEWSELIWKFEQVFQTDNIRFAITKAV